MHYQHTVWHHYHEDPAIAPPELELTFPQMQPRVGLQVLDAGVGLQENGVLLLQRQQQPPQSFVRMWCPAKSLHSIAKQLQL